MSGRYALVGCGKSKRPGELPAKDKYDSPYFKEKREFAETCDRWWILSAKYGCIPPDKVIDDYDVSIDEADTQRFRRKTFIALRASDAKWMGGATLFVLAGQKYIQAIQDVLDGVPAEIEYPFDETGGIGEQRQKLGEMNEDAASTRQLVLGENSQRAGGGR